jgi:light-independent protochlorophyllide reductase subunit B
VAETEMGFKVVGLGTYSREFARDIRAAAKELWRRAADHRRLSGGRAGDHRGNARTGARHADGAPHRQALGIGCAVISAPVHVQDFPARYSPQMGFEGANVLFDSWVHPLVMGLEEHLLGMFRDDFEFSDANGPSHHGHAPSRAAHRDGGKSPLKRTLQMPPTHGMDSSA